MLHLSEISLKWVRNIRDYVKEGQKVVLIVLDVNPERGHIDLSLRRVTDSQRKEKLQEVKQKQRALKLFELLAKELGLSETDGGNIKKALIERYESPYAGLESISTDNSEMDLLGIDEKWKPKFLELINKNIKSALVSITGYLEIKSYNSDGIGDIKGALSAVREENKGEKIDVSYVSAPLYRIKVTALDYKHAEKVLKSSAQAGIDYLEKRRSSCEFHRKLAEKAEK